MLIGASSSQKTWMLRQLPWGISWSWCFSCCFSYLQRWLPRQTTSSQSDQPVSSLIRVLFWVYIMRVSCFKLEVLDLCNFLLCLQRRREARQIFLLKSKLRFRKEFVPREIRMPPTTIPPAVIDSYLKSLPMIIKRNSLEFATNIVVTFPLKYVSRLIPVSINIICR